MLKKSTYGEADQRDDSEVLQKVLLERNVEYENFIDKKAYII